MKFWFSLAVVGLLLFFCGNFQASAQLLPANQPEQDACGALNLCGGSFSTPYSYQGIGFANNLSNTPCGAGEANSVWLKLTASTSGTMVFTINPVSAQDDYDFAVLNITNTSCSNLGQGNVIRCNFNNNNPGSNVNGVIGLSTSSTQAFVAGGTFGSSFCSAVNVTAGQVFLIMINNFGNYQTGGPSSGFTINFAGSTATFNSPPLPRMDSVRAPDCLYKDEVTIKLSTEVKCSSIAANGSDFSISPAGTIVSAQGINCNGAQGYTDRVRLVFASSLPTGSYTINARSGTDGNTLLDLCNNALALPNQVSFVVRPFSQTVSLTKCQNELPFVWNGITVNAGGSAAAIARTTTSKGCDSTTTLNLTVLPSYSAVDNRSVCSSALPYLWNGISVNSFGNGAAVYRGRKVNGCDSTITLNLTMLPSYASTVTLNACSNRLPYIWNGIVVPAGGVGVATFRTVTAFGCDSVVTLNLNVSDPKTYTDNQSICVNQLPFVWNGITVNAGGNAVATYTGRTTAGCDSVVTLNLTVKSVYSGVERRTICSTGLPYTWNGMTVLAGGPTAAIYRTTGVAGCDSVVTLNLTVLPATTTQVNLVKCARDLPFVWNGITVSTGGTAVATWVTSSVNGCDSTVKLNLTVLQPTTAALTLEGCDLVTFKGKAYTSSQVVQDTLYFRFGCDSIYRTTQINVYKTNLNVVTKDTMGCGFLTLDRVRYTSDTSLTRQYKDIHGCDSLFLTTRIAIHPENPMFVTLDTFACDSLLFEQAYYRTDTLLRKIFSSQWGCDSLVRTVRVHVEHFDLDLSADETAIVNGEVIRLSLTGNLPYQVIEWTPVSQFPLQTATEQSIRPSASETYRVRAASFSGCVDTAAIRITVDTLIADAFMPNAFTPNGDGLNDYFSPKFYSKRGYVIEAFLIYNRWGQQVFTGHGANVRWDGTFNSKPAEVGTYFYNIILSFANGTKKAIKGNVELLR